MKSLWFLVYDTISMNGHQLESSGALCQVSGFLFSMGIESADAAVFLIALHSSVDIFWPNRARGESGLYSYRRITYCFYVLWPTTMASLAFAKGVPAYVNTGQSCYLPTAPWWYRIALSWAPRCAILLIILIMYASSYTYVRIMMLRYSRRSSEIPVGPPDRLVPSTPPLLDHGLLPSPPDPSYRFSSRGRSGAVNQTDFLKLPPEKPLELRGSFRHKSGIVHHSTQIKGTWSWPGFVAERSVIRGSVSSPSISPMGIMIPGTGTSEPVWETNDISTYLPSPNVALCRRISSMNPPPSPVQAPSTISACATSNLYRRPLGNNTSAEGLTKGWWGSRLAPGLLPDSSLRRSSWHPQIEPLVHICTILRQGPPRSAAGGGSARSSSSLSSPSVMALDQATFESGGITRSRDRIRRQLRLLFVYPAVYACVWVFPFASDVSRFRSQWHGNRNDNNPFWLLVVSLISLRAQGLCDAAVFLARERPWRHARSGFRESYDVDFLRGWRRTPRDDSGRTREEMFNDSARARSRRVEELEREQEYRESPSGRMPPTAGASNWFDVDLYDENHVSAQTQADGPAHQDIHKMEGRRRDSQQIVASEEGDSSV